MDKQELITKLAKCRHNPIKDVKALEAFSEEGLKALDAHCAAQSEEFTALTEAKEEAENELKALQEKVGASDTKIKTLEADLKVARRPLSDEDWMKQAPESIRGLVERQKKVDEEKKDDLVATLKAAQEEFTEDELKAMSLAQLERTARMLKIDEPPQGDFSAARRTPVNRAAADADVYQNPPDPYAAGIEKHQKSYNRVN